MLTETAELARLRLEACRTCDKSEFEYCYRTYRRKGGLRKIVFVPKRAIKQTYNKVFRIERNGKKNFTYYQSQLSNELKSDCLNLKRAGMLFADIAESLAKNYGFVKENSVKYVCRIAGRIV